MARATARPPCSRRVRLPVDQLRGLLQGGVVSQGGES